MFGQTVGIAILKSYNLWKLTLNTLILGLTTLFSSKFLLETPPHCTSVNSVPNGLYVHPADWRGNEPIAHVRSTCVYLCDVTVNAAWRAVLAAAWLLNYTLQPTDPGSTVEAALRAIGPLANRSADDNVTLQMEPWHLAGDIRLCVFKRGIMRTALYKLFLHWSLGTPVQVMED